MLFFFIIHSDISTRAPLIVDLGCGPGNTALALSQAFPNSIIIGLDIDETMVAYAQEHNTVHIDCDGNEIATRCQFFVQDIGADWNEGWSEELKEILTDKVDAIFSNYTLHWINCFNSLATNVWQLLRPNGRSVFVGNLLYCGDIASKCDSDEERAFVQSVVQYPNEQQYISDFMFAFRNSLFNRFVVEYQEPSSFYPEGFYKNSMTIISNHYFIY